MTEEEQEEDDAIEEIAFSANFTRGDVNEDGQSDISDQIMVLNFLFLGGAQPSCMDSADANDDGTVNIADPSMALAALFLGGEPIPAPSVAPGADPTPDSLECFGFSAD